MHLMQILRAIYVIVPPFVCLLALVICHIYIYQQRSQSEPFTDLSPQEDEEPSPDVSTDEPMPAASTNTVPRIIMYYPDTFAIFAPDPKISVLNCLPIRPMRSSAHPDVTKPRSALVLVLILVKISTAEHPVSTYTFSPGTAT